MATRKRVRLATGVYQDRFGISVRATKTGHQPKEIRYPLGTPLQTLRTARADLRQEFDLEPSDSRAHTLHADFDAYLATFPAGSARRRDESALLQHWRDAGFGARHRDSVSALEIRQQLAAWQTRFKPATINHLRRVLGAVYVAVNGRSGANPVRDAPKLPVRYEEPRAIPYPIIDCILASMPDIGRPVKGSIGRPTINQTKLRLRVMAYTGLPPAQLARVERRDLNLKARTVFARPRRKGAGVDGYTLPLIDKAVEAFRAFDRANLYGAFSARSAAKVWRRAVTAAKAAWQKKHPRQAWPVPDNVRAYDLRHSFGSAVMLATGDIETVANLLMHTSLTTTRRYVQAAVTPRMQQAAAQVNAALEGGGSQTFTSPVNRRQKAPEMVFRGRSARRA